MGIAQGPFLMPVGQFGYRGTAPAAPSAVGSLCRFQNQLLGCWKVAPCHASTGHHKKQGMFSLEFSVTHKNMLISQNDHSGLVGAWQYPSCSLRLSRPSFHSKLDDTTSSQDGCTRHGYRRISTFLSGGPRTQHTHSYECITSTKQFRCSCRGCKCRCRYRCSDRWSRVSRGAGEIREHRYRLGVASNDCGHPRKPPVAPAGPEFEARRPPFPTTTSSFGLSLYSKQAISPTRIPTGTRPPSLLCCSSSLC